MIQYKDLSSFNDCLDFSEVENKTAAIIYIILWLLFASAYRIFRLVVIFYFSPILFLVTDIIYYLIRGIFKLFEDKASIKDDFLYAIGYLIMFLSSLIYNEIIILHFCGLNKNTKIFVENRQIEETIELNDFKGNIILDDLKIMMMKDMYH